MSAVSPKGGSPAIPSTWGGAGPSSAESRKKEQREHDMLSAEKPDKAAKAETVSEEQSVKKRPSAAKGKTKASPKKKAAESRRSAWLLAVETASFCNRLRRRQLGFECRRRSHQARIQRRDEGSHLEIPLQRGLASTGSHGEARRACSKRERRRESITSSPDNLVAKH